MISYHNPYFLICTFFGLGHLSKKFPGTIGSIIGIPVSYFIMKASSSILGYLDISNYTTFSVLVLVTPILVTLVMIIASIFACNKYVALGLATRPKRGDY